jgi:hypothetical protein
MSRTPTPPGMPGTYHFGGNTSALKQTVYTTALRRNLFARNDFLLFTQTVTAPWRTGIEYVGTAFVWEVVISMHLPGAWGATSFCSKRRQRARLPMDKRAAFGMSIRSPWDASNNLRPLSTINSPLSTAHGGQHHDHSSKRERFG